MKILPEQLDKELNDKINRLDSLEANFNIDSGNIVAYDGHKYFTTNIEIPHVEAKAYFTSDYIRYLKSFEYKSDGEIKSSFDTRLIASNIYPDNFKTLYSTIDGGDLCRLDSKILLFKSSDIYYYAYTESGKIYKIQQNSVNIQTAYDVLRLIKTNFVCPNLTGKHILDFIPYRDGFLISTINNGIYYIDITHGIYELKFNQNYVISMSVMLNDNICTISKQDKYAVVIYNFDTGLKVESYNTLRKVNPQIPFATTISEDNDLLVLGMPSGLTPCDNLLHMWKFDSANITYTNIDDDIAPNKCSVKYEIKFLGSYNNRIYISGVKDNHFFVWIYNRNNMIEDPKEIIFKKVECEYDDLLFTYIEEDGSIYFNIKNRLLNIDFNSNILANEYMNNFNVDNSSFMKVVNNKIIAITNDKAIYYTLPKYNKYPTLTLEVYNGSTAINELDILISASNSSVRIALYDGNTMEQLVPIYYAMNNKNESLIHLSAIDKNQSGDNLCRFVLAKKIMMKLTYDADCEINSVIINNSHKYCK